MSAKICIASYLFRRLKQSGVDAIYGVPGDFTLKAIDQLQNAGIKWIGTCNELNAGYAADGHARIKGLGALLTTYGVGELSAINAVAGSRAEFVPVIHIVGAPNKPKHPLPTRLSVHHSLPGQDADIFSKMHGPLVCAQCHPAGDVNADKTIDNTILSAIRFRRPAYIQLASNATEEMISSTSLSTDLVPTRDTMNSHKNTEAVAADLIQRLQKARFPLLLVDRSSGLDTVRTQLNEFVRHSGIPTLTMPSGAGMIDNSNPNYHGVHSGPVGQFDTMPLVEQADLVVAFGPMFSDTQTLGWKTVPHESKTVTLTISAFSTDDRKTRIAPMDLSKLLSLLKEQLAPSSLPVNNVVPEVVAKLPNFRSLPVPQIDGLDDPITQSAFYQRVNAYIQPHDIILLANATPILGGRDFVLPSPTCRVIVSGRAFSIGHMLPAALGAAVAQQHSSFPDIDTASTSTEAYPTSHGRTVLFDGDGSFQVTAQELSTIIRLRLNVTIFIMNNAGYAYERLIHGAHEEYNNIAEWDYLSLPAAFGGRQALRAAAEAGEEYGISCCVLRTWRDLENFLKDERFDNGFQGRAKRGLKMVDVRVGRMDVPENFKSVFAAAAESLNGSEESVSGEDKGTGEGEGMGSNMTKETKGTGS